MKEKTKKVKMKVKMKNLQSNGRATGWPRGPTSLPKSAKLRMPVSESAAVRLWGISFIVERETAQTTS